MKEEKSITGIILAGGKSSRMGSEKGLMLLNNKPFIQYSIEALQPLVDTIMIVSSNSDYDVFGLKRIEDIIPDSGPIAGVHTGLTYSKTENNLVISCDVPLLTTSLLKKLVFYKDDDYDIIQFEAEGKTSPLVALYKKHCVDKCKELLIDGEKRLRKLVLALRTKTVSVLNKEHILVTNINTIEDLKRITNAIKH
ncbi:molybdenum cofactor guanylyltransferase [Aquimarina longa]|uniref:molybdenum cofactor guanylyltransferase n=1 Tax=Aquimarina longa TaxID=1080221 RepID=UPI000784FCC4|nr:molybdenum cofactor guanylyltransferase [Aquimarina longa]